MAKWVKVLLAVGATYLGFKALRFTLKWSLTAAVGFGLGFWLYLHLTGQEEAAKARLEAQLRSRAHRHLGI